MLKSGFLVRLALTSGGRNQFMAGNRAVSRAIHEFPWAKHCHDKYKVKVSEDETEAEVEIPGFYYGDLNSRGTVSLEKATMKFETGHLQAVTYGRKHTGRSYVDMDRLLTERIPFLGTAQYRFTPQIFSSKYHHKPIKFEGCVPKMGQSSFIAVGRLGCSESGELLATSEQIYVSVGFKTRRPEPNPDWFTEKFKFVDERNYQPFFKPYKPPPAPSGGEAHKSNYKIMVSDLDYHGHCSNNSYVRFCLDKAFAIPEFKKFSKLNVDVLSCMYMAESRHLDDVTVTTWLDPHDDHVIHFLVEKCKKDQSPIVAMTVKFTKRGENLKSSL